MNADGPGGARVEDGGSSDLRGRAARGGSVVLTVQLLKQGVQLVLLAILARLLTPHDYGLIGMVLVFVALLATFQDLGLATVTIQRKDLTEAQHSTLFWLTLALGLLLTLLLAAASPLIARFYGEPILVPVCLLLSLGFVIASLGTQSMALLNRRMDFGAVAVAELGGLVAGGLIGIAAALAGLGVFALVAQRLAMTSITAALYVERARWRPGLPQRGVGVRSMMSFGGYLSGFNVLNYFTRNFDKILLGRFWGTTELGLYTRAYTLMTLPVQLVSAPMARVLAPALARLQDDPARFAEASISALRVITWASFPLGAGLALLADETILIVFGEQWLDAVPVYRVLCLAGLLQALLNVSGTFFVSRGKAREFFRWGLFASTATVIGFVPCIWYGGIGAAVGYTVVVYLTAPLLYWVVDRVVGLPLREVGRGLIGPAVATGLMSAALWHMKYQVLADWSVLARMICLVASGVLIYSALSPILARRALHEVWRAWKQATA